MIMPIIGKDHALSRSSDGVFAPVPASPAEILRVLKTILSVAGRPYSPINTTAWPQGRYMPTPTIIEAALALYHGHSVAEISRSDAGAKNLHETTAAISQIIVDARDRIKRAGEQGQTLRKGVVRSQVKAFIQNVHHYRDAYLEDSRPPADHVALFDEAQRAWNWEQTQRFMEHKRNKPGFEMSEPEFLISCIDRHKDWGVIVCLVGGGQEINTGEAGIGEWLRAVEQRFPHWHLHVSDRLTRS